MDNYWKNRWSNVRVPVNNFAKYTYSVIKRKKAKKILDLGSGMGQDSVYFASKGFDVTAVDFSESGIKKLKNLNKDVKVVLQDIKKFKLKPNYFDVIYAHLSLHYFDDQITNKIFKRLHKALKRNGLIFVKCKSINDPLFGQGQKIAENIYKKGHVRHFFSKEYMAEKLRDFKIISLRKTSSHYNNEKSAFIEAAAKK